MTSLLKVHLRQYVDCRGGRRSLKREHSIRAYETAFIAELREYLS